MPSTGGKWPQPKAWESALKPFRPGSGVTTIQRRRTRLASSPYWPHPPGPSARQIEGTSKRTAPPAVQAQRYAESARKRGPKKSKHLITVRKPVRQNGRFSELQSSRVFTPETGVFAVRNTGFANQSSIYSRPLSKSNPVRGFKRPKSPFSFNVGRNGCFRSLISRMWAHSQ